MLLLEEIDKIKLERDNNIINEAKMIILDVIIEFIHNSPNSEKYITEKPLGKQYLTPFWEVCDIAEGKALESEIELRGEIMKLEEKNHEQHRYIMRLEEDLSEMTRWGGSIYRKIL